MKIRNAIVIALGSLISQVLAAPMGILVPAYFYPTTDGLYLWPKLNAAASQVPITAILNSSNGEAAATDTNYEQVAYNLSKAGGNVIAYVHTWVSPIPPPPPTPPPLRNLSDVEDDIDRNITWYGPKGLNGIFVDEMRNDPTAYAGSAYPGKTVLDYYQAIYKHITSAHPQYRVIGNPGGSFGNIALYLQFPRSADALVTFENGTGYEAASAPVATDNYSASNFANIPYNIPSPDTMDYYVRLAKSRNVGYIYVTNGPYSNPWNILPSYWEQEVQLVKSINDGTLPTKIFLDKVQNQAANLFVSGNPGNYQIQASNNMVNWSTVTTSVTTSGGFTWTDSASVSLGKRFYRTTR